MCGTDRASGATAIGLRARYAMCGTAKAGGRLAGRGGAYGGTALTCNLLATLAARRTEMLYFATPTR
eukprot:2364973-Rhodomonas_salina.2